ncbi:hypothetical protein HK097_005873, partial [Rhizophlyctis rosea]
EILRRCEEYVEKETGISIRLAEKPMDVPASFLAEHKLTITDKWVRVGTGVPSDIEVVLPEPVEGEGALDLEALRKIEKYKHFDFRRVYLPSHKNAMEWFLELRGTSIMKHSSGTIFLLGKDNRWRMAASVMESDLNLQIADTLVESFRELLTDVEDDEQELNLKELRKLFVRFRSIVEGREWSISVARNVYGEQKEDDSCINRFLSHPELFAFEDGVYELFTGTFRPFQPEDYILFTCGYNYPGHRSRNPKIRDHINRFYSSIFRTEAEREYRFFLVSRCCYGRMVDEIYVIQRGPGRNGKGTEATLISRTFGNYFQRIESKNFTGYSGNVDAPNSQLFKCFGKRYISTSETKTGEKFSSMLLKIFSGRDPFSVRDLRGKCITFPFTGPLHIESNADLTYDEVDQPLILRSQAVSYPFQFILKPGSQEGGVNDGQGDAAAGENLMREMDPTLKDSFMSDEYRDEFIMMLFDHFREVVAPKNLMITVPEEVAKFTQQNAMANMNGALKDWLKDRYKLTGHSKDLVKRAQMWALYKQDMDEADRIAIAAGGSAWVRLTMSKFFAELKTFLTLRVTGGNWVFEGLVPRAKETTKDSKGIGKESAGPAR